MGIQGIGIDTVEVARMRSILAEGRERFLTNTFTDIERTYCTGKADAAPHFAGAFAAKEAFRKATGDLSRAFHEVGVEHEQNGKPYIALDGKRDEHYHLSITHTDTVATAIVIYTS